MARRDTGNHTRYWRSRWIPGMSLLRADFRHHDHGTHTHDTFVIAVTETGGAEIRNQRRSISTSGAAMALLRCNLRKLRRPAEPPSAAISANGAGECGPCSDSRRFD